MNILDIAIAKKLAGGGGGSGTDNYNDLSNLPKINDTTLSGNKSSSALGLQSEINSDSKLASDLVDDTNQDNKFVTSTEKNTWNGKQNAIDADHKINADYVDDSTSTNKFVTASDKETWNAKQNAIDNSHKLSSDLVDDTNHTNKFVTSTEKQTWNNKQNAIDSDHKLSSSLVSFTTAEAAALASGIDSSKVGQISTNQTNILYAIRNGAKNLYEPNINTEYYNKNGANITQTYSNGAITIKGTTATAAAYLAVCEKFTPNYTGEYVFSSASGLIQGKFSMYVATGSSFVGEQVTADNPARTYSLTAGTTYTLGMIVSENYTIDTTIYPMLCEKTVWDNLNHDFQPPSLPNYDLTRLEAEDRAALAEEIDAGAKNLFEMDATNITRSTESNYSVTGSTFQVTASKEWSYTSFRIKGNLDTTKTYVLSYRITAESHTAGSTESEIRITPADTGGNPIINPHITGTGTYAIEFKPTSSTMYLVMYANPSGDSSLTNSFTVTDVMVCTKAAFCLSNKFVPYRPNYDAVSKAAMSAAVTHQTIQNADLNSINRNYYGLYQSATNMPSGTSGFAFVRTTWFDSQAAMQELTLLAATSNSYVRVKYGNAWTAWKQVTNA